MYRVLIADDEEPVIESYSLLITRDGGSCRLAACARNGSEALELLRTECPDIAYIDINMPGLDGLEVIRRAREDCPSCIFILSTAYERFDLARKAIPLGVHAYLVKPVTGRQFLASLEDAVRTIEARRKRDSVPLTEALKEKFLRYSAWESLSTEVWEDYRASLDLGSGSGSVAFIWADVADTGHYAGVVEELEKSRRLIATDYLHTALCLIPDCGDTAALEREIKRHCAHIYGDDTRTCLSVRSYEKPQALPEALREGFSAIRETKRHQDALMRERVRSCELRRRIGLDSREEAWQLFDSYWKDIVTHHGFDGARYKMVALLTLLTDDLYGTWKDSGSPLPPFIPSEDIPLIQSLGEWELWAEKAFNALRERALRNVDSGISPPLRKALSILDEHYGESLQLGELASRSGVSPGYLSRLFTEQLGISFIDYLTRLRMEKAEKLLGERLLSIKETSQRCGYSDPNYFAKLFKKATGISPSMYAEKHHEP